MRHEHDPDRTRLDPYPAADPTPEQPAVSRTPEPPPVSAPRASGPYPEPYRDEVVEEGVSNADYWRIRAVNITCTIIMTVTVAFAVVLGVHILLVLGNANMSNDFASFVDGWASGVTLGLTGLFTPGDPMLATLLNEGIAAVLWLVIGGALTYLIRRFALPGPRRLRRYRRVH